MGSDHDSGARGVRHPPARIPPLVDVVLAAGLVAAAVATVRLSEPLPVYRGADGVAFGLAVAAGAVTACRRRWPRAVLALTSGIVWLNARLGFAVGAVQYPVWLAVYSSLAVARSRRDRALVLGGGVLAVLGYVLADRGTVDVDAAVGICVAFALAVLAGEITRARRALAATERAKAALEHDQQLAAREHLLLQERARLARELHDALGHAVNVMVMQAGVARHVFGERPDFARSALGRIETLGRDALVELDAVLRVLRDDHEPPTERAVASLAGLEVLCERIRGTGRRVDVRVAPVALTPAAERAAYRIVQEALTNAARHGADGPIAVSVEPGVDHAVVTVRNAFAGSPSPPAAGRGLVNMRERARLEGGELHVDAGGGSFVVRATLPLATVGAG